MIVVIGGIKGGSGKTMLATNLAVMRSQAGKRVLLVDADEQHSAADWAAQRSFSDVEMVNISTVRLSGKTLYVEIQKMMKDYDDVIVDMGGRDTTSQRSALSIADVLITPIRPRSVDIWTLDDLQSLINQITAVNHKLISYAVINQADPSGSDNEDAFQVFNDYPEITCLPTFIGMRKIFPNAVGKGKSVIEMPSIDIKANNEMKSLYNSIYGNDIKMIG